eukprot:GHVU01035939.1.p1 GENE.GHVU01035939.1~~GHVU01035939.1.p1  ORF type:complete len:149 (-),score=12.08 GHVU01035939.1:557-1003(-)
MVLLESCSSVAECCRAYVLAILCLATFGVFCYAFARIWMAPARWSRRDATILLLSTLQVGLGFVYYGIVEMVELVLGMRALKVLQAIGISWIVMVGSVKNSRRWHAAFVALSVAVVATYVVIVTCFKPAPSACRGGWVNERVMEWQSE